MAYIKGGELVSDANWEERLEDYRLESLDRLIETAKETIEKATRARAIWLVVAAEKELNFATYQKQRLIEKMMKK